MKTDLKQRIRGICAWPKPLPNVTKSDFSFHHNNCFLKNNRFPKLLTVVFYVSGALVLNGLKSETFGAFSFYLTALEKALYCWSIGGYHKHSDEIPRILSFLK